MQRGCQELLPFALGDTVPGDPPVDRLRLADRPKGKPATVQAGGWPGFSPG